MGFEEIDIDVVPPADEDITSTEKENEKLTSEMEFKEKRSLSELKLFNENAIDGNKFTVTGKHASSTHPTGRRSKTPFSQYLSRHSEDPNAADKFRSITPFLNRSVREKTVFELGTDIKSQLISHKMVIDRASVMDISDHEPFDPVRFITSDIAVVDRALVMDVSNIEVIYMIEEYEEEEEEQQQIIVQEEPEKKKKPRKARKGKSDLLEIGREPEIKEGSVISNTGEGKKAKAKKGTEKKKKKVEAKSPSPPKITLKLELGAGSKMNRKMFDQKPAEEPKPEIAKRKNSSIAKKIAAKVAAAAGAAAAANATINGEIEKRDSICSNKRGSISETKRGSISEAKRGSISDNKRGSISTIKRKRGSVASIKSVSALSGDILFYPAEIRDPEDPPEEESDDDIIEEEEAYYIEEEIEELEPEKELTPEPEPEPPYRSPSPEFPEPKPKEFWMKITAQEGKDFSKRMQTFYDNKRDVRRPAFIMRMNDVCATEGDKIRLVCAVTGPNLRIRWLKDDEPLLQNDNIFTTIDEEILTLNILNSTVDDTAEYTCVIANDKQILTNTSYVNVCESFIKDDPCSPSIESFEHSYHFIDDKLILECVVHGIPRPKVRWYKDDYEIFENLEHSLNEGPHGSYILFVHHPSNKDSGTYKVVGENENGMQEIKHRIEFLISDTKNFLLNRF